MNAYSSNKENQFLYGKIASISLLLTIITALPANAQSYDSISLKDPLLGTENAAQQFYREGRELMEREMRQLEQQSQHHEQKKPLLHIESFDTFLEENREQPPTREVKN